jgi:hypothetical protein
MNRQIDKVISTLTNKETLVSIMFTIFMSLFGGKAAPPLPNSISSLFSNQYFNMAVIALVAYGANSNINMSVISSILFYNVINNLN